MHSRRRTSERYGTGYEFMFWLQDSWRDAVAAHGHPSISNVNITASVIRNGRQVSSWSAYHKPGPVPLDYRFHTNIWRVGNGGARWQSGDTLVLSITGVLDGNPSQRLTPGGFAGKFECRL